MSSRTDAIHFFLRLQNELGFVSAWSANTFSSLADAHPFPGHGKLIYTFHWGAVAVSIPIEGKTWLDLWTAAEKAIHASGDLHHVFIERFEINAQGVLEMFTGS